MHHLFGCAAHLQQRVVREAAAKAADGGVRAAVGRHDVLAGAALALLLAPLPGGQAELVQCRPARGSGHPRARWRFPAALRSEGRRDGAAGARRATRPVQCSQEHHAAPNRRFLTHVLTCFLTCFPRRRARWHVARDPPPPPCPSPRLSNLGRGSSERAATKLPANLRSRFGRGTPWSP